LRAGEKPGMDEADNADDLAYLPGNSSPLEVGMPPSRELDSLEGPLDLLPRIPQSYWTSMRTTGRKFSF